MAAIWSSWYAICRPLKGGAPKASRNFGKRRIISCGHFSSSFSLLVPLLNSGFLLGEGKEERRGLPTGIVRTFIRTRIFLSLCAHVVRSSQLEDMHIAGGKTSSIFSGRSSFSLFSRRTGQGEDDDKPTPTYFVLLLLLSVPFQSGVGNGTPSLPVSTDKRRGTRTVLISWRQSLESIGSVRVVLEE